MVALSKIQKKANEKYIAAHYDRIPVSYPREFCAAVRSAAAEDGVSLAGYVRAALEAYMAQAHAPALPQAERPGPARVEAEKPAPRKRGRPRKNPIADTPGPAENKPAAPGAGLSEAAPDMPGPAAPVAGSAEYHAPGVEASPSEDSGPA